MLFVQASFNLLECLRRLSSPRPSQALCNCTMDVCTNVPDVSWSKSIQNKNYKLVKLEQILERRVCLGLIQNRNKYISQCDRDKSWCGVKHWPAAARKRLLHIHSDCSFHYVSWRWKSQEIMANLSKNNKKPFTKHKSNLSSKLYFFTKKPTQTCFFLDFELSLFCGTSRPWDQHSSLSFICPDKGESSSLPLICEKGNTK